MVTEDKEMYFEKKIRGWVEEVLKCQKKKERFNPEISPEAFY